MSDQIKVFGIEWYDVKTRIKQLMRAIIYTNLVQSLICLIIVFYLKLVYYSSKKVFIGEAAMQGLVRSKQPFLVALWHSRIMMSPFLIYKKVLSIENKRKFCSLSSKHGDGQFVGRVMEKFGLVNISGSTQDGRKASRGIDIGNFREILRSLKSEIGVAITPDGPRGPAQKVGGEIIKIAQITGAPIIPFACGYSKFKKLKTWDQFLFPLPFGTISFYCGEFIEINKDASEDEIKKLNLLLEEKINLAAASADKAAIT